MASWTVDTRIVKLKKTFQKQLARRYKESSLLSAPGPEAAPDPEAAPGARGVAKGSGSLA